MVKGSIQQEDVTKVNMYAPNARTLAYLRRVLTDLQGGVGSNTIIMRFQHPPFVIGRID